jgi:S-formylglutathione hydrolase FrmB
VLPGVIILFLWLAAFVTMLHADQQADPKPVFDPGRGIWHVMLPSEYQEGPVDIQILLPARIGPAKKYPVLYILPVGGNAFGDGLEEAQKADAANKYNVICVAPSFTSVPWYGDHATDPKKRHEQFMLRALIPYVEAHFPAQKDKEGRWLIGFSKSGWGACTLLMRHMDTFGYAAAWDVPFMLNGENWGKQWGPMGIDKAMGTKEVFQQFLPTRLAAENAVALRQRTRLVLGMGEFWRAQCEEMHAQLAKLEIPHVYRSDLLFKHRWDTGWFQPMLEELVKIANAPAVAGQ